MLHVTIPSAHLIHLHPLPVKLALQDESCAEHGIAQHLVQLQEEPVLVVADRPLELALDSQGRPVGGFQGVQKVVGAIQEGLQLLVHEEVCMLEGQSHARDQKR